MTGSIFGGVSAEVAAARIGAALGPCAHPRTDSVVTVRGETVAEICLDCLRGLPLGWRS